MSADQGTAFLQGGKPERSASVASGNTTSRLSPASALELGGSLERLVLNGNVRLVQPGRTGTGEQLTYVAATDSFVLTGTAAKPPRCQESGAVSLPEPTLLFRRDDSTIVVAGAKAERRRQDLRGYTQKRT